MATNKTEQQEIPGMAAEEIAVHVAEISSAMKKLKTGRLNDKAISILMWHACGRSISMNHIDRVLRELELLEKTYLKPKAKT